MAFGRSMNSRCSRPASTLEVQSPTRNVYLCDADLFLALGSPGADRVIFDSKCAVVGEVTHEGAKKRNGFDQCQKN